MVELTTVEDDEFVVSTNTDVIPTNYYYTFSVYAKAGSGSESITLGIAALDADDVAVEINGAPVAVRSAEITLTNTWQRYSITLFLPESNVDNHLLVDVSGTGAGNVISLDAAQVESGYTSTDYFDGDYTPRGAYWVGDENSSKSIFYSNKVTKLGNLTTQLPDYVPLNTAYVVTSGFDSLTTVELKAFSS
jgi:sulfur carrier protein ThiS